MLLYNVIYVNMLIIKYVIDFKNCVFAILKKNTCRQTARLLLAFLLEVFVKLFTVTCNRHKSASVCYYNNIL